MSEKKQKTVDEFPDSVYLIINSQVRPIHTEKIEIGRLLENDIVIQDDVISRHHAQALLFVSSVRRESGVDVASTFQRCASTAPPPHSIAGPHPPRQSHGQANAQFQWADGRWLS